MVLLYILYSVYGLNRLSFVPSVVKIAALRSSNTRGLPMMMM